MKEPLDLQDDIARALRMFGQARPPKGMQTRIVERIVVERMNERQAGSSGHSGARKNSLRWTFAVAAVVAVVMLMAHHRVGRTVAMNPTKGYRPHDVVPPIPVVTAQKPARIDVVRVRRPVRGARLRTSRVAAELPSLNPPPLPLTQKEELLLALAQRPRVVAGLGSVVKSETVVDHGLGENALFELDHEELAQLKTTLQLAPLKNTLP